MESGEWRGGRGEGRKERGERREERNNNHSRINSCKEEINEYERNRWKNSCHVRSLCACYVLYLKVVGPAMVRALQRVQVLAWRKERVCMRECDKDDERRRREFI